jgi:RNA recognition motif-containing protein
VSDTLRIYLGNLPPSATRDDVRALFAGHGEVTDVDLIVDQATGTPRGFGFVTMEKEAAARAVAELDGLEWQGSILRVNESHDRGARAPRRSW